MTAPFPPLSPEREALELLKLSTEIDKLQTEAERAKVDKIKAEAEAASAQHDAALKALDLARLEREERDASVSDDAYFTYLFDQPVDEESVGDALETVDRWHRLYPESDWHIVIDSPGGLVNEGLHLFDQLHAYSNRGGGEHHITMTVRGMAASMGGVLLQAADQRLMGRNSLLLIHQVSAGTWGSIEQMKDDIAHYEMHQKMIVDLFVERSRVSRKKFEKTWSRRDWWIPAKQAVKLGFADGIG